MTVKLPINMPKSCWGCKFSQINAIQNTSICLLQAITNRDPWDPPSIIDKGKKDDNCPLTGSKGVNMIPTKKRIVYEYKCRQFWKKGKSVQDSYRYTINGKVISRDEYFKIKLPPHKSPWFLVSQGDYETKDGNMCYEVVYCTFRQVKE